MKRSSYGERDYAFGQIMLSLRTAIGLTQASMAEHLGVSRHAVGKWEAGSSYPKAEHLKALLALAIGQQAFPAGREEEEIRAFWKVAHQKVLLDESWLSTLLSQQSPSLVHMEPVQVEQTRVPDHVLAPAAVGPRVEWSDALDVPSFYGREGELATLAQWVVQERCRVVSVLGMGGIGKSALAVHVMHRLAEHFKVVIFRSLRDAPSCEALLEACLQVLSPELLALVPESLERRLSLLLEELRTSRVLLVLDNLESLLSEGDVRGVCDPALKRMGACCGCWPKRRTSAGRSRGRGELLVWDAQSGQRHPAWGAGNSAFAGHAGVVYAVTWGPSGDLLVSGGSDGMLRWWDVQSGECVRERQAHPGTIRSLRSSPDGSRLASCGDDGAITLWNLHSGEYVRTLRRDRPYERLNITGIRGLSEAQKATLRGLGAMEDAPDEIIGGHFLTQSPADRDSGPSPADVPRPLWSESKEEAS